MGRRRVKDKGLDSRLDFSSSVLMNYSSVQLREKILTSICLLLFSCQPKSIKSDSVSDLGSLEIQSENIQSEQTIESSAESDEEISFKISDDKIAKIKAMEEVDYAKSRSLLANESWEIEVLEQWLQLEQDYFEKLEKIKFSHHDRIKPFPIKFRFDYFLQGYFRRKLYWPTRSKELEDLEKARHWSISFPSSERVKHELEMFENLKSGVDSIRKKFVSNPDDSGPSIKFSKNLKNLKDEISKSRENYISHQVCGPISALTEKSFYLGAGERIKTLGNDFQPEVVGRKNLKSHLRRFRSASAFMGQNLDKNLIEHSNQNARSYLLGVIERCKKYVSNDEVWKELETVQGFQKKEIVESEEYGSLVWWPRW